MENVDNSCDICVTNDNFESWKQTHVALDAEKHSMIDNDDNQTCSNIENRHDKVSPSYSPSTLVSEDEVSSLTEDDNDVDNANVFGHISLHSQAVSSSLSLERTVDETF